ncbi:unnamed protein product [Allacma fusca]|uniref:DUF4806 domain-containing protein n=1 Tax=Allacma fusca TaxID=39272 RepID=A0A8J2K5T8_9HEXA|nr:unnamed protein product [Allacma fusca]
MQVNFQAPQNACSLPAVSSSNQNYPATSKVATSKSTRKEIPSAPQISDDLIDSAFHGIPSIEIQQCYPASCSVLFRSVLSKLSRIEHKLDEVSKSVATLKLSPTQCLTRPDNCPDIPMKNIAELEHLNLYLEVDDNLNYMAQDIAKTGGDNDTEATDRVLGKMFASSLAVQLNWKGILKKNSPAKTGLCKYAAVVKLILDSVRIIVPSATDKAIQTRTKHWLKHSKSRLSPSVNVDNADD